MKGFKHLVAVTLAACSLSASAATVTVDWANPATSPPGGDSLNVSLDFGSNYVNSTAGRFNGVVTSYSGIDASRFVNSTSELWAYCYDLYDFLADGQYEVVLGGAHADVLDFLGAVNSVLGGGPLAWLDPGTASAAAAIQLGIWDALYDGDFLLNSGVFQANGLAGGTQTAFDTFVAAMAGAGSISNDDIMVLTAEGNQDVITGRREQIVPEPGSLALLGLGAAAAAFVRKRRR